MSHSTHFYNCCIVRESHYTQGNTEKNANNFSLKSKDVGV